jgi:hypothetical protein
MTAPPLASAVGRNPRPAALDFDGEASVYSGHVCALNIRW